MVVKEVIPFLVLLPQLAEGMEPEITVLVHPEDRAARAVVVVGMTVLVVPVIRRLHLRLRATTEDQQLIHRAVQIMATEVVAEQVRLAATVLALLVVQVE
jgi:hypothetical protein